MLYEKEKEVCPAYISKYNSTHEKQIVLLSIPNGKNWHYLAVTKLSALLRGIASKQHTDFYFLNCFHSFVIYQYNKTTHVCSGSGKTNKLINLII